MKEDADLEAVMATTQPKKEYIGAKKASFVLSCTTLGWHATLFDTGTPDAPTHTDYIGGRVP